MTIPAAEEFLQFVCLSVLLYSHIWRATTLVVLTRFCGMYCSLVSYATEVFGSSVHDCCAVVTKWYVTMTTWMRCWQRNQQTIKQADKPTNQPTNQYVCQSTINIYLHAYVFQICTWWNWLVFVTVIVNNVNVVLFSWLIHFVWILIVSRHKRNFVLILIFALFIHTHIYCTNRLIVIVSNHILLSYISISSKYLKITNKL